MTFPYLLFAILVMSALLGWLVATLTAKRFEADWAEVATDHEKTSGQLGRIFRLRVGIYTAGAVIWGANAVWAIALGGSGLLIALQMLSAVLMVALVGLVYWNEGKTLALRKIRKRLNDLDELTKRST
jgi:hypothetical protein